MFIKLGHVFSLPCDKSYKYFNNISNPLKILKTAKTHYGDMLLKCFNFNFNFILPKVNTDYMRQAQVLNIDKLRLIINLRKFNKNVK